MAKNKNTIKDKSNEDLAKLLVEKRDELQKFTFSISGSKGKNVHAARDLRRDIARILTEMNARKKNA